jgi:serine/threonine-protein kinase HipA
VAGEELAVWLYGSDIARIAEERRRPRLAYTAESLGRYAPGTPLLSLSLPVRPERYPQGVVRPFLDGLLPEGEARRTIAREFGVRPDDTFGLIGALGRDCAGAIVIQPTAEPAPRPATTLTAEPLDENGLAELVLNLKSAPLGAGGRVRISLAGIQEKLLLTRMPDGSWGRPVDGTPSTHILKPEIAAYPATVANEALCMRLASELGVEAAQIETADVAGRKLIVVQRYDRVVAPAGDVHRIHQEDFCQATGVPPDTKYQEDRGPSLARIGQIVQTAASPDSLERLLRAVTVNVLVGNGDAHAKNFSLLHEESGTMRLAPLYDVMCTQCYGDDRLAMYIDNVQRTSRVTAGRIVNEAAGWGLSRRRAAEVIDEVIDLAPQALEKASAVTDGVPDSIRATVHEQIRRLRSRE